MSSWYNQPLDKAFWSAMAPQLPYFALLRNLRNLDEVGLDRARAETLARKIADEAQVRKSGIFPFQFLTAYHNVRDDRWLSAISDAASHSLANIPTLPGRTLVLVDTSASMEQLMAQRENTKGHRPAGDEPQAWRPRRVDAAALFAASWVLANPAGTDLQLFASATTPHRWAPGTSLLRAVTDLTKRIGVVGHGTLIADALRATWDKHDRAIIFTDEQTFGSYRNVSHMVPDSVPVYSFNLAGYAGSMLPLQKPNRIQLGGLTDKVFSAIPSYEAGRRASWPWEDQG
jgi:TROVE domain